MVCQKKLKITNSNDQIPGLGIFNLDQLPYFASWLSGLDNCYPRMIQLYLNMRGHTCYQSLKVTSSSSASSCISIINCSSSISVLKFEVIMPNLMLANWAEVNKYCNDCLFVFQRKIISNQHEDNIVFCRTFLIHLVLLTLGSNND